MPTRRGKSYPTLLVSGALCVLLALILLADWSIAAKKKPGGGGGGAGGGGGTTPAASGRIAVTPENVDKAIARAVAFLYSHQKNGTWDTAAPAGGKGAPHAITGGQWGGHTALVTYALLAAGESAQGDKLAKAISFLEQANIGGIYALGMRANVWAELPLTAPVKQCVKRDAQLLFDALKTEGGAAGLYDYLNDGKGGRTDHSVSQYGVLGMWACVQTDVVEPDRQYWQMVENAWIRDHEKDGGWNYTGNKPATVSMTAAGIATLFLTQDYVHGDIGVGCEGNAANSHIEAGIKFLADHFKEVDNNYSWYGVERIGVASGRKYIGNINWYHVGADHLLNSQGHTGEWDGHIGGPIANTAFGILFLTRGRAPVMINKLQYTIDNKGSPVPANWNQRPRDIANLVRWTGKQTERFLNWQIVTPDSPLSDLMDAQILYISGDASGLIFTAAQEAKLKQFVEAGGVIVGNADCGFKSRQFVESYQALAQRLFKIYEFRTLPKSHLLFHNHYDIEKWHNLLEVRGLSNGARELMLLFPKDDPAKFWQTRQVGGKEVYHQFMANLFLYTTEKQNPRVKGQSHLLTNWASVTPTRGIKIARLQPIRNSAWDPEPGGWRRFAAYMHNREKVDLQPQHVELGKGQLSQFKIAHMTGVSSFKLLDAERSELQKFVKDGGTLIVDACGGNADFKASIASELDTIFGKDAGQLHEPLKANHPAYHAGSVKIDSVAFRMFAQRQLLENLHVPRIRGIDFNGRVGVFYSEEDLSLGLVGQSVDGVFGYAPNAITDDSGKVHAGATEIMASLVLYAARAGGDAPVRPPGQTSSSQPPKKNAGQPKGK